MKSGSSTTLLPILYTLGNDCEQIYATKSDKSEEMFSTTSH
jgi:hypothetical protein